jgi:hypothetical protein
MIICPFGVEIFHTDRRTDRHDEANSLFAILRRPLKGKIASVRLMIISPDKLKI